MGNEQAKAWIENVFISIGAGGLSYTDRCEVDVATKSMESRQVVCDVFCKCDSVVKNTVESVHERHHKEVGHYRNRLLGISDDDIDVYSDRTLIKSNERFTFDLESKVEDRNSKDYKVDKILGSSNSNTRESLPIFTAQSDGKIFEKADIGNASVLSTSLCPSRTGGFNQQNGHPVLNLSNLTGNITQSRGRKFSYSSNPLSPFQRALPGTWDEWHEVLVRNRTLSEERFVATPNVVHESSKDGEFATSLLAKRGMNSTSCSPFVDFPLGDDPHVLLQQGVWGLDQFSFQVSTDSHNERGPAEGNLDIADPSNQQLIGRPMQMNNRLGKVEASTPCQLTESASRSSLQNHEHARMQMSRSNCHTHLSGKKSKPKFLDFTPGNEQVAEYCKTLVNVQFHGQCEGGRPNNPAFRGSRVSLDAFNDFDASLSLATVLSGLDKFLRSFRGHPVSGSEEEFLFYTRGLLEQRDSCHGRNPIFARNFISDAKNFVKIYNKRGGVSEELRHEEYWGTRQQLLAGKVIADFVDTEHGPMDPVFGVLLSPVAGRTGPGDSGVVHSLLFDEDGPVAYHSAVHDAFGYLLTTHRIGPGYDYMGSWTLLEGSRCMSGQLGGFHFWRDVLRRQRDKQSTIVL